jgi:hypothetical protein
LFRRSPHCIESDTGTDREPDESSLYALPSPIHSQVVLVIAGDLKVPKHEECTAYIKHAEKLEKDASSVEKIQLKKEVKNEE